MHFGSTSYASERYQPPSSILFLWWAMNLGCAVLSIINVMCKQKYFLKTIQVVPSGKNLGPRGLLPLWSQVRAMWLFIWWPLETYMVITFRAREISRATRKLARTPMLNSKKKKLFENKVSLNPIFQILNLHQLYVQSSVEDQSTQKQRMNY
jgi:hypothetical protein